MEQDGVLLYAAFKEVPQMGRVAIIKDDPDKSDICGKCYAHQFNSCHKLIDVCYNKDVHFEQAVK